MEHRLERRVQRHFHQSSNIWAFETGNGGSNPGWGNSGTGVLHRQHKQCLCYGNGLLHIVARQESTNGFSFTSARMKTEGLYNTPTYGRIQWRAKLPTGLGMWPALWMLGADSDSLAGAEKLMLWRTTGTIRLSYQSSLHSGTDYQHVISQTGYYYFPSGDSITNFHIYEMDWSASHSSFLWMVIFMKPRALCRPLTRLLFPYESWPWEATTLALHPIATS